MKTKLLPEIENALVEMTGELEAHRLLIVLAPAPRPMHCGHCVRVKADVPPRWYRDLCGRHLRTRRRRNPRPDTLVNRADILGVLSTMLSGRGSRSRFAPELLTFAIHRARRNAGQLRAA